MIDTHAHLNISPLVEDVELYLQNASSAGVKQMMIVGVNYDTSLQAVLLAAKYPNLWAAVGIHPEEANQTTDFATQLQELVKKENVSAIGECGLDYSENGDHEAQKKLFLLHIELALSTNLPLIIHCRTTKRNDEVVPYSAYDDLLSILSALPKCPRYVLHCVSGSVAYVQRALGLGAFISFAGNVTYPNAGSIRELLSVTPLDRLLVETDSPFLSPQTKRGTQNEPANVCDTARFVAQSLNLSYEELDTITTANALKLFTR